MIRAAAVASLLVLAPLGCATSSEPPVASPSTPGPAAVAAPSRTVASIQPGERTPPAATDAKPSSAPASDVQTTSVPMDGTDLVRGKSTVKVAAPIDKVREAVLGFSHYAEFMPHYKSAKVLGRAPSGGKDVYMEVEALNGAAQMWARVDVPKPTMIDGVETYDTKFLDGNVREFKAIWRLKKLDEQSTELSLEVFMYPKLPLPSGLLNSENVKGSASGVLAMRARAEGQKAP
ncbi:MAG TPA: SRPBCC family protein [Byssovorax sp.]